MTTYFQGIRNGSNFYVEFDGQSASEIQTLLSDLGCVNVSTIISSDYISVTSQLTSAILKTKSVGAISL